MGGVVARPHQSYDGYMPYPDGIPSYGLFRALMHVNLLLAVFILLLLIPTRFSFEVLSMRMTGYRMVLLLTFVPMMIALVGQYRVRLMLPDILVTASGLWAFATCLYHLGVEQGLVTGGIYVVESVGAYLVARLCIRDGRSFAGFVAMATVVVLVLLLASIPENLTGRNLFGQPALSEMGQRMGLNRARGPLEHPILLGSFTGSIIGLAWYALGEWSGKATGSRLLRVGGVVLAACAPLSSGPMTAVTVQQALILYDRVTGSLKYRWWVLIGMLVAAYVFVDVLSTRSPIRVFLTYMTFSAHTAYNRLIIWEWGFHHNVLVHPWVGIGPFAEWVRPGWMHSMSMDNFWLVLMTRHGIPCVAFLATGIGLLMWKGAGNVLGTGNHRFYKGWVISMIGLMVAATTVHYWNATFAWFFLILGSGAWMAERGTRGAPAPHGRGSA